MLPPLLLPRVEVAAEGYSKGEAKAPITIVEFSDFECPFCSKAEEAVKNVLAEYKGKVRLVYRDFPLPFHSKAQKASEAALCAGEQGKYWEMHEKLFANQQALELTAAQATRQGGRRRRGKFDQCLDSGAKASVVEASKKVGEAAGRQRDTRRSSSTAGLCRVRFRSNSSRRSSTTSWLGWAAERPGASDVPVPMD